MTFLSLIVFKLRSCGMRASNVTLQVTDEAWKLPLAQKHEVVLKHNSQQVFTKVITSRTIIYTCFVLKPNSIEKQETCGK